MESGIDKLLAFLKEIEKFKGVERRVLRSDKKRRETAAEHSWHMAVFLLLFEKELPKGLDFGKMLKMALIHDLPEIYAGDTFLFDKEARKSQKEREMKAAERLFSKLPEDMRKEFAGLFLEFEEGETREAKFVKSFDKLHPILQNILSDGSAWKEHGVKYRDVDDYKRKYMTHNDLILGLYEKLMKEAKDRNLL